MKEWLILGLLIMLYLSPVLSSGCKKNPQTAAGGEADTTASDLSEPAAEGRPTETDANLLRDELNVIANGDYLFFLYEENYHTVLVIKDAQDETKVSHDLLGVTSPYQVYLSSDRQSIIYNTKFRDIPGRLMEYDLSTNVSENLLEKLSIEIDGWIAYISHVDGVVSASIESDEEKINEVLMVDLNNNRPEVYQLPFTAKMVAPFYLDDNHLLLCYSIDYNEYFISIFNPTERTNRVIITSDVNIHGITISPTRTAFSYCVIANAGQRLAKMYIYNIDAGDQEEVATYNIGVVCECTHNWGADGSRIYYVIGNDTGYDVHRYNLAG